MTDTSARLQETVENQKRIITALQNEVKWLMGVIMNPSYNEVDMRILVNQVPREMRMGYTSEMPEQKIYLPAVAEEVHASPKTITKRIHVLEQAGIFQYRTSKDEETGNTRSHLRVLPSVQDPAHIEIDRVARGGSTWNEGKRVKKCKDCGSSNLIKVTSIYCGDCGSKQSEDKQILVNVDYELREEHSDLDEGTNSQYDRWGSNENEHQAGESTNAPNSQYDCWSTEESQPSEIPNVPPITVYTLGVETEQMEPPEELRSLKIWGVWRYEPKRDEEGNILPDEKPRKVLYHVKSALSRASHPSDPTDLSGGVTYDEAKAVFERSHKEGWKKRYDGIGAMANGEYTYGDIDHCIADGLLTEDAASIIKQIDTYTEVTPSGTGIRFIAHGTLPRNIKQARLEMYDHVRFMTFTGKHLVGTPTTIAPRQTEIDALFGQIAPPAPKAEARPAPACVYERSRLDDDALLERARTAGNGSGERFCLLWDGKWKEARKADGTHYSSQSEADLALCRLLAFWAGNDEEAVDRLFCQSKLYRPKWKRKARSGETYGEGTIRMAMGRTA